MMSQDFNNTPRKPIENPKDPKDPKDPKKPANSFPTVLNPKETQKNPIKP